MKHAFQPLVLSLLLGAAGCASSGGPGLGYQNINAFTTLYLDIQEARVARPSLADIAGRRTPQLTIPPRNIFSIRDLVAAAVQNYSYQDQLVLVEYLRADTREPVYKKPLPVAAGAWAYTAPTQPLPAGEYLLRVTPIGMQPFMQSFSVRGL